MIESVLESVLLYGFAFVGLIAGAAMLVLRHPMRVALALSYAMICLGGVYGLLGVHVIAVFQILIYVSAVMVFMVYVIMLLDVRDPSFTRRFSHLVIPGAVAGVLLFLALERALGPAGTATMPATVSMTTSDAFSMKAFSVAFLDEYWLYFELTSVLLVAAVVAAVAVIRADGSKRG